VRNISLDLVCELTDAELQDKGQKMSSVSLKYDEVEDRKKSANKEYSDELKALRGEVRTLSIAIRKKSEIRTVECAVRFHVPEPGMKRIIRMDTGKIVRDEQMSPDERQTNLFEELNDLNKMFGEGPENKDDENN
jgi:hypothetical protein